MSLARTPQDHFLDPEYRLLLYPCPWSQVCTLLLGGPAAAVMAESVPPRSLVSLQPRPRPASSITTVFPQRFSGSKPDLHTQHTPPVKHPRGSPRLAALQPVHQNGFPPRRSHLTALRDRRVFPLLREAPRPCRAPLFGESSPLPSDPVHINFFIVNWRLFFS